ncbi:hypothetical protein GLOIN_2v82787 [Rhizophagus irregularis DAOM 181602=DAOM 197198]|uniref:Uncharacterized protein n=1 Tax=Rhizophagus irregularis (strain DAOM 181602 / DAOM 197198 / MUCL 43194) TaxID=747089 RepID=A0A2P4Q0B4_RHIID|nr:hypothetical protein GLOIN_2v82787 [Rhizophagus irregularis DAOM 181602=DAOM 197198]POG71081.1 hypothetical protein GLOIN_2v82787 [Rhizophagus irregularis DAOM 181602=DAOM 197198]|eukprot:XP_025177947.1 hypothetical protein GLOIN_2v82787 [Rhizophagus irregularis DAOM 181602=DAOM 197198]
MNCVRLFLKILFMMGKITISISNMYILYTNDILSRTMTENEYFTYVWIPLISFAFLGKDVMFISRLKKLVKAQDPKVDSEVTTMSSGVEVIFQENVKNGTQASDPSKLEYCTKILLLETICIFGLSDITIPQTVNEFPRCLKALYKILSWKSRLQRNAKNFHELLGKTSTKP